MSRFLVMTEVLVTESERQGYGQSLAVRRARAATASVNFWVFEQAASRGCFLEFFEAGSRDLLQLFLDAENASHAVTVGGAGKARVIWREVSE